MSAKGGCVNHPDSSVEMAALARHAVSGSGGNRGGQVAIVAARVWQLFFVFVLTECGRDTEKATKPHFT